MTTTEGLPDSRVGAKTQSVAMPAWATRPRTWGIAGVTIVGAGLALNWTWLTAIGAAPILLGLLPCAAMCALGLCMRGGASESCSGDGKTAKELQSPTERHK
jgi:hypothetical protein